MSKSHYRQSDEIIVKRQADLDEIPLDFQGRIYIDGGTWFSPIIVINHYKWSVEARGNSSVVARGNSSVVARGNSSVVARENSSVVARGNSSVEARENSSVEARENSSVEAWENSSVVARGNVQALDMMQGAKVKVSGNSRIVYMPKTIFEFMDFYGIKYTKKKARFYKAVRKDKDGIYFSNYDNDFKYKIGEIVSEPCNDDPAEKCGSGLHISHLNWALIFGAAWSDLAILEVETNIADIVKPNNTDGKVRTSKLKVLREVPLEECGIYGKILARRRKQRLANTS